MAIKLTWYDNNAIEGGFRIYRGESPLDLNNLPEPYAELPADTREFTDDAVIEGAVYYYVLETFNSAEVERTGQLNIKAITPSFVYTADASGFIKKIDPTGTEVWSIRPYSRNIYDLTVDHLGNVYSVYDNGYLFKVDQTGNTTWNVNTGNVANHVALKPPMTYVVNDSNLLLAYYWDGSEYFRYSLSNPGRALTVADDGSIYVVEYSRTLRKFNSIGELIWTDTTIPATCTALTTFDNVVYYGDSSGNLGAFNPDGTIAVANALSSYGAVTGIAASDNHVYAVHSNVVVKYDLNLNEIWNVPLASTSSAIDVDENGEVFIGQTDKSTARISTDGTVIWKEIFNTNTVTAVKEDIIQKDPMIFEPFEPRTNVTYQYAIVEGDAAEAVFKPVEIRSSSIHEYVVSNPEKLFSVVEIGGNVVHEYTLATS